MTEYVAANGTSFTEADIDEWAAEAEADYTGGHLGPAVLGRPVSVGHDAKPFTLRLDHARRAKLKQIAEERHTTASQLMRDLIDAL